MYMDMYGFVGGGVGGGGMKETDRKRQRGRENHRGFPSEGDLKGVRPVLQQILYLWFFN